MASLTAAERLQLLARSWTTVAEGYRSNFVHRFAPWTQDSLRAFVQAGASLPESGAIAVPACGPGKMVCTSAGWLMKFTAYTGLTGCTDKVVSSCRALQCVLKAAGRQPSAPAACRCPPGQELPLLAAAFPRHRIMGIDLSEGMVTLARQLVQQQGLEGRVEVRWVGGHVGGLVRGLVGPPSGRLASSQSRFADVCAYMHVQA